MQVFLGISELSNDDFGLVHVLKSIWGLSDLRDL